MNANAANGPVTKPFWNSASSIFSSGPYAPE